MGERKNYFNEEQNRLPDKLFKAKIKGTGLTFDFECQRNLHYNNYIKNTVYLNKRLKT